MVVIFSKDNTQFYNTELKKYQKYNMDGKNKTQQEKVDKYNHPFNWKNPPDIVCLFHDLTYISIIQGKRLEVKCCCLLC